MSRTTIAPRASETLLFLVAPPGATVPVPDRSGWTPANLLEAARAVHPADAVDGARAVFRIMGVFVMVTGFWALFDQHGASWILQATQMNLQVGAVDLLGQKALYFSGVEEEPPREDDIPADLVSWKRLVEEDSGYAAGYAFANDSVLKYLLANETVKKFLGESALREPGSSASTITSVALSQTSSGGSNAAAPALKPPP